MLYIIITTTEWDIIIVTKEANTDIATYCFETQNATHTFLKQAFKCYIYKHKFTKNYEHYRSRFC